MRFKLDENLPIDAAGLLAAAGHDAHTVLEEGLGGQPDPKRSEICRAEDRILVTLDTDFCNILNYPPEEHSGIIVIRTLDQSKSAVLGYIKSILSVISMETISGRLWIVQKDGIRSR